MLLVLKRITMLNINEKKLLKILHDIPKSITYLAKEIEKLQKLKLKIEQIREDLILSVKQNNRDKENNSK